jgi:hypothetical protein
MEVRRFRGEQFKPWLEWRPGIVVARMRWLKKISLIYAAGME